MSLINDALKRARQQTGGQPARIPPEIPTRREQHTNWILPVLIILLIATAAGLLGLSFKHQQLPAVIVSVPPSVTVSNPPQRAIVLPTSSSNPPKSAAVAVDTSSHLPRLQGVFYDPVHPVAIVDGKTVHIGDNVGIYRVKAISKSDITLAGPSGALAQIRLGQ